jgi:hypothetical protein
MFNRPQQWSIRGWCFAYVLTRCVKGLFGIVVVVVVVVVQSVFRLEMHQNEVFSFFKNHF